MFFGAANTRSYQKLSRGDYAGKDSPCVTLVNPVPPVVRVCACADKVGFFVRAMTQSRQQAIRAYYQTLFAAWGCQHWWPAQSRLEMIVGAFLTQNTAWTNVEKELSNLRSARLLTLDGIRSTPQRQLEQLIRPSGYFRQKAQRLKTFVNFLDEYYGGSLCRHFPRATDD